MWPIACATEVDSGGLWWIRLGTECRNRQGSRSPADAWIVEACILPRPLAAGGLLSYHVVTDPVGRAYPGASGGSEQGWSQNRRDFII